MKFTQDTRTGNNVVRGYGAAELRINDAVFRSSLIVSATAIEPRPNLAAVAQLQGDDAAALLAHRPELVLLGTGARQEFPHPSFGANFLRAGIGFEVMDTGAACRTFNVLVAEARRVVALLIV